MIRQDGVGFETSGSLKEHSLKLTAKAPENGGLSWKFGDSELGNHHLFTGELLVLGSVALSFGGIKTMQRLPAKNDTRRLLTPLATNSCEGLCGNLAVSFTSCKH